MRTDSASILSPRLLSELAARGDSRKFSRGEVLMVEGHVSDALFILITGQLKVFTRDRKGRELIYNILEPGEFLGEMFLDGGVRSASVKAVVDSNCIAVDHSTIREFMISYPEFAECLVLKLIERLRHATRQIKSLGLDGVYERTLGLLDEVAQTENGVRIIPPGLTQQEIADRIGATREMVNHVFNELLRGGMLVKDGKRRIIFANSPPEKG
jgi:CRP/FNR family cyclic AMP-dependent transcriptional regulator